MDVWVNYTLKLIYEQSDAGDLQFIVVFDTMFLIKYVHLIWIMDSGMLVHELIYV